MSKHFWYGTYWYDPPAHRIINLRSDKVLKVCEGLSGWLAYCPRQYTLSGTARYKELKPVLVRWIFNEKRMQRQTGQNAKRPTYGRTDTVNYRNISAVKKQDRFQEGFISRWQFTKFVLFKI